MTEVSSLTGRLLVATPALADPNFERAVVLLLDHDEEGSLGVVLNRPTPVDVGDILEGWGPGQLEDELGEGAWYVVESEPGDVSCPAPERLWREVLRRQRGDLAMVATYPDDPSLN